MQTRHSTCISIRYDHVLAAWREQANTAANSPDIKHQILYQERELLPRFAAQYTKLSALPRRARRAMQRQWKRSLAGVAFLLALGQAPAMAATINVGAGCSLVNAITAANTDAATGGCKAGSGADRIVLPKGSTQTLSTVNNSDFQIGDNGLPVITSTVTIVGNGATIKRPKTAPDFRIFFVDTGARLTLQQTRISGGKFGVGGAVFNLAGTLTLTRCILSGNTASAGAAIYNGNATLSVNESTISGNIAVNTPETQVGGNGGAIFGGGTITVTNSTISGNSAEGSGAAGGALQVGGTTTVTNSTISGNQSAGDGGGVFNSGDLTVTNSTITRNSSLGFGGGANSFFGSLTLNRTLVSGNRANNGREVYHDSGYATIAANNFNVFGFNRNAGISGFRKGATDIVPRVGLTKVLNTTLANNGGRTRTHALPTGSPAIDSVSDGTCPPPARDQRGTKRPRDGNRDGGAACDTGSFER